MAIAFRTTWTAWAAGFLFGRKMLQVEVRTSGDHDAIAWLGRIGDPGQRCGKGVSKGAGNCLSRGLKFVRLLAICLRKNVIGSGDHIRHTAKALELNGKRWYSWVGSNHRPPVPQTGALTN